MANDITKGKIKQVKGKVREESGKLTGNKSQEIKGQAENTAGKLQEQYGKAKRNIKKAMRQSERCLDIENIISLSSVSRYFLEFQTRPKTYLEKSGLSSSGFINRCGHATRKLGEKAGRP